LLAASETVNLLLIFIGGEITFFLTYKLIRKDYYYFVPLDGLVAIVLSFATRGELKVSDYMKFRVGRIQNFCFAP